tara:strand:+ start:15347 stop:15634 length:288 start_codon:yes stop_codon:yes gene_type:complete
MAPSPPSEDDKRGSLSRSSVVSAWKPGQTDLVARRRPEVLAVALIVGGLALGFAFMWARSRQREAQLEQRTRDRLRVQVSGRAAPASNGARRESL